MNKEEKLVIQMVGRQGHLLNYFLYLKGYQIKKENKKYKLVIPGNNAFGTGCHAFTYLSIKGIEYLTKNKIFQNL